MTSITPRFVAKRRSCRHGVTAVEMAVIAPVVLLLAAATTDFGRVVQAYCVVSNAARCGAEYGSLHNVSDVNRSTWQTSVTSAVTDEMQNLAGYNSSQLGVSISTTTDSDSINRVSVTVSYPFQTTIAWPGIPSTVALSHAVQMRRTQ